MILDIFLVVTGVAAIEAFIKPRAAQEGAFLRTVLVVLLGKVWEEWLAG